MHCLAVDAAGDLYIADTLNNRIRKVTVAGTISTVAGDGTAGFSGDRGPAGFDLTHILVASWAYDLPFGPGKALRSGSRVLDKKFFSVAGRRFAIGERADDMMLHSLRIVQRGPVGTLH